MSVRIVRDTVSAVRPVFAKIFELFTGGFGWSTRATDRFDEGVIIPAGTLLVVDEEARTAHPVKRGRTAASYTSSGGTGVILEPGHLFQEGDDVFISGGTTAVVESITTRNAGTQDEEDYLVLSRVFGPDSATGETVLEGTGTTITGTANAIAAYPTTVEEGASVTALRRGTVYTNRIQPVETHDDLNDVTLLSDSN